MEYTVVVVCGLDTIYQPEIGNIRPNQYKSINAPHQGHNGEPWTEGSKQEFQVLLFPMKNLVFAKNILLDRADFLNCSFIAVIVT